MPVPTLISELSTTAASNFPAGSDSPANLDDVQRAHGAFIAQIRDGVQVTNASEKTTPVNADYLPINDSAASNLIKKVTWANVKATLKTYFDTLYAASGANGDITSLTALTSPVSEVRQLQPITAAIASNAITIAASALSLEFRNTTLTNGAVSFIEGTPAALTIASTDSFGLVTAAGKQRIAILAINNAGTIELAASALAGCVSLDETGVITTATAATLGTHIKAANVRTGVAYRVIGFVDATFTTATGWGSLALVQGTGGQALAAMSSLGYGQTWQNVAGSRAPTTNYYNTTGKPITVFIYAIASVANVVTNVAVIVNGFTLTIGIGAASNGSGSGSFVVPPGGVYSYSLISCTISTWNELR